MKKTRAYLDPKELTPEERADRIVELLAEAAYKMAFEETQKAAIESKRIEKEKPATSDPPLIPTGLKSGLVPYGQVIMGLERVENEKEMKWIKRIQELKKAGLSTEKIAKRLNEEDKESRMAGKWCRSAVWRILKRVGE